MSPVEVGNILVEWRWSPVNQRARVPAKWVGYHQPVYVETDVGPLQYYRRMGWPDNIASF